MTYMNLLCVWHPLALQACFFLEVRQHIHFLQYLWMLLLDLSLSSEQARLLQDTQLIIWDDVPMQNKEVVEAVDKCLRDITKVNCLFGGIPGVLGVTWAQILPVVPRRSRGNIVNACLQQLYIWPSLQKVFLRQNLRAVGPESEPYTEWLRRMSSNPALFGTVELPQFFTVV